MEVHIGRWQHGGRYITMQNGLPQLSGVSRYAWKVHIVNAKEERGHPIAIYGIQARTPPIFLDLKVSRNCM